MEYEKCYVFQPDDARPAKRQRTEPQGLQASWGLRQKAYQQAWQSLKQSIDTKLEEINSAVVANITAYLEDVAKSPPATRIPTGLILTGPSATLHSFLTRKTLVGDERASLRRIFVPLTSSSGSNLKGLLKVINQIATSQTHADDEDEDENITSSRKGTKLLNYDLQVLHDYVQERRVEQVVIAFEDTEAFDSDLLSEVIELLRSWLDRIPIVCLFSIATSVEFLQQRLSTTALKCLDGKLFDAVLSREEVEAVFNAVIAAENPLWIGPGLMSVMLERQSDYLQSIDTFVRGVQYAYMSSYYANALSIFLSPDLRFPDVPADHFEALRNTDSFQTHLTRLVNDDGDTPTASALLSSDEALFALATESVSRGRDALAHITAAIDLIRSLQQLLPNHPVSPKAHLYTQALSGKLHPSSPLLRSLFLSIRKTPSSQLSSLLSSVIVSNLTEPLTSSTQLSLSTLESLLSDSSSNSDLQSADALASSASSLRTTIVAQKVALSKRTAQLSSADAAYTDVVRGFATELETSLAEIFGVIGADEEKNPLLFPEIFLVDVRRSAPVVVRDVFAPRPRAAIERALAAPGDYLDCECCRPSSQRRGRDGDEEGEGEGERGEGEEVTLAGTQPSTAVLYQLYLEGGGLINVRDLWEAFRAVVTGGEGEERPEAETMGLFQRALAELRYLGFVKGTRKRVDHVAKVAWRGL